MVKAHDSLTLNKVDFSLDDEESTETKRQNYDTER